MMVVLIDLLSFRDYILPHLRLYVNPFFKKIEKFFRIAGRLDHAGAAIKKSRSALYQQGSGHPRFPSLMVLHVQLAHLQLASATLGLVKAVAIRHLLVKVRIVLSAVHLAVVALASYLCNPTESSSRGGDHSLPQEYIITTLL